MVDDEGGVTLDQTRLLRTLRRHALVLVTAVLLGVAGAAALLQARGPEHTAEAVLLVGEPASIRSLLSGGQPRAPERLLESQLRRLEGDRIRRLVEERVGVSGDEYEVDFASSADTNVVAVRATAGRAPVAVDLVNAYAEIYLELLTQDSRNAIDSTEAELTEAITALSAEAAALDAQLTGADASALQALEAVVDPQRDAVISRRSVLEKQLDQLRLVRDTAAAGEGRVISLAGSASRAPVAPLLAMGALLGLAVGTVGAAVLEAVRGTVVDAGDVRRAGLRPRRVATVAGPRRAEAGGTPGVLRAQLRDTATRLWPPHGGDVSTGVCLLAHADARDDSSLLLATALAEQLVALGYRVVVADTVTGRPAGTAPAGPPAQPGLPDVVRGAVRTDSALVSTAGGWELLPAGQPSDFEHLAAPALPSVLDDLRERADVVLLVSAPLVGSTDAWLLAPLADRVVVLADAGRTRLRTLVSLRDQSETARDAAPVLLDLDVVLQHRRARLALRAGREQPRSSSSQGDRTESPSDDRDAVPTTSRT